MARGDRPVTYPFKKATSYARVSQKKKKNYARGQSRRGQNAGEQFYKCPPPNVHPISCWISKLVLLAPIAAGSWWMKFSHVAALGWRHTHWCKSSRSLSLNLPVVFHFFSGQEVAPKAPYFNIKHILICDFTIFHLKIA